ncbi:hypothetical protein [Methanocella sp. MCL-LM]|uniref:hypothetical protein n=1 Tax=Methanocella sp. MCL-LM TaxID=3412035 RepID=UPI003C72026E
MSKTTALKSNLEARLPVKIIVAGFVLWLLNVLFVALHEAGHAMAAASFGAEVFSIYISPAGYCGGTCYTVLSNVTEGNLVLAGGILATTLATLIFSWLKLEFAVYVIGLRTIESLLNFSGGSDMAALTSWAGPSMYGVSFMLTAVTMLCVGKTAYENRLCEKRKTGALRAP